MATLRKWKPVDRRPQQRGLSLERMLAIGAFAIFGFSVYHMIPPPGPSAHDRTIARELDRATLAERRALAEAQRAEAAERARLDAQTRQEHAREQAALFQQRYKTDRTPVGTTGGNGAPKPVSPGFRVVKPAIAPELTGGGIREISGWTKR